MLGRMLLSEDLQREIGKRSLTESTMQISTKQAKYIVGIMEAVAGWSQFETKSKRVMSRLSMKQPMVDDLMGKLKDIAKMEEETPEE